MSQYVQVFSTVDNEDDAKKIATYVVEKRLAACVQIIKGISSVYWWQGEIESSDELLLIMKSKKELYKKLESAIVDKHPYDCPEIIAMPIENGYKGYLGWMDKELLNE